MTGAGVATLTVLDDFGIAAERADLRDAGNVPAIPFDAELEILVGIEALRVRGELSAWGGLLRLLERKRSAAVIAASRRAVPP